MSMNIEEDNELTTEECEEYLDEYMKGSWYAKKMLTDDSEYVKISDLAKRFITLDKENNHIDWNLEQILIHIRMTEYYSLEEIRMGISGLVRC